VAASFSCLQEEEGGRVSRVLRVLKKGEKGGEGGSKTPEPGLYLPCQSHGERKGKGRVKTVMGIEVCRLYANRERK